MSDPSLDTMMLHDYLSRWKAGDREAMNELVGSCHARLARLACHMLRSFPNVGEWEEAEDVLQSSLLRLLHTLESVTPETSRDFFNLAALHIRRELLDLARHYRNRRCVPLDLATGNDSNSGSGVQPASPALPEDFETWCRFHEAVDQLVTEEREVVSLIFYHNWTQRQIAELFQVDERTIRRRWTSACTKLQTKVEGRDDWSS